MSEQDCLKDDTSNQNSELINQHVEDVLTQIWGDKTKTKIIEVWARLTKFALPYKLEVVEINTQAQKKEQDNNPIYISFTGIWGKANEVIDEAIVAALVAGEKGLRMNLVSLPGHGGSEYLTFFEDIEAQLEALEKPQNPARKQELIKKLKTNFRGGEKMEDEYFDRAAVIIAAYIQTCIQKNPGRKIILNAWPMGGIAVLKAAAKLNPEYQKQIEGIILMDTPVFPMNYLKAALRFVWYGVHAKGVKREKRKHDVILPPVLALFLKRIKERNIPRVGMPFWLVKMSGKSLSKQDLSKDYNTLRNLQVAEIPILLLHPGANDLVIPMEYMHRLEELLKINGVKIKMVAIKNAGHSLPGDQPSASAQEIKEWLDEL